MMLSLLLAVAGQSFGGFAPAVQQRQSQPVTKIIETMQNLLQSVQEEHRSDENNYKASYQWCNAVFNNRKQSEQRYASITSELQSKLNVQQAINKQLKDETDQLAQEIAEARQAVAQGQSLRQNEHGDYLNEQKGFAGMVTVLNKAVNVLSSSSNRNTLMSVTRSLQQIAAQSTVVSDDQRDQLAMFAQRAAEQTDTDDTIQQSQAVMSVLKELMSRFQGNMANGSQQERSSLMQYDGLIKMKKQEYMEFTTTKDTKDALLAESLQKTAQIQRSLQDAQVLTSTAQGYLKQVQVVCGDKSNLWASRSQARAEVGNLIQQAIAALGGDSLQLAGASLMSSARPTTQGQSFQQGGQQAVAQQRMPQQQMQQQQQQPYQQNYPQQQFQATPQQNQQYDSTSQQGQLVQFQQQASGVMNEGGDFGAPMSFVAVSSTKNSGFSMAPPSDFPSMDSEQTSAMQMNGQQFQQQPQQQYQQQTQQPQQQFQQQPQQQPQMAYLQGSSQSSSQQVDPMMIQQEVNNAPKQNTYSAVTHMVEEMTAKIQAENEDEEKHRGWCNDELAKNSAVQSDKSAKLQRLRTKIDNEQELVNELETDLQLLQQEQQGLQDEAQQYGKIRMAERQAFAKATQNHNMALQILKQATMILQRFSALARDSQTGGFLQTGQVQIAPGVIDSFSQLQQRYQNMEVDGEKGENQGQLDLEAYSRQNTQLATVLTQTKNYKASLKLQSMSEFDEDKEDHASLQSQVQSATAYVQRLREACSDILQHYDERRSRRQQSLQALAQAKNVINVDNAEQVHQQLSQMAAGMDQSAASLLATSTQMGSAPAQNQGTPAPTGDLSSAMQSLSQFGSQSGFQPMQQSAPAQSQASQPVMMLQRGQRVQPQAPVNQARAPVQIGSSAILGDLQSLQDINFSGSQQQGNGLNMLPSAGM